MIGNLLLIGLMGYAGYGGYIGWPFWPVLVISFFAGAVHLANSPSYDLVISASRQGRLGTFPKLLLLHVGIHAAVATAIYFAARWLAG